MRGNKLASADPGSPSRLRDQMLLLDGARAALRAGEPLRALPELGWYSARHSSGNTRPRSDSSLRGGPQTIRSSRASGASSGIRPTSSTGVRFHVLEKRGNQGQSVQEIDSKNAGCPE